MSQQATSTAAITVRWMWPPSSETLSSMRFASAVMRRGSSPMARWRSSWTPASVVAMKPLSVPSPMPWMPASVETRTKSQFFQPAPTVKVSMPVIFMRRPFWQAAASASVVRP